MEYSVLMSVYYKEKPEWLKESITSILNQTIRPKEIVLVEDGPLTEGLMEVIEYFNKKYLGLFKIVPLKKNVGLGPALAIGIENCNCELVARMDSDDISHPMRCEKELMIFEKDADMDIVGSFEVEFENDIEHPVSIHRVPEMDFQIKEFMRRRCALLHPTVMYKKTSVINSGNYRDVKLYEDYDLFIRMTLENNCKSYNIQDNLYYMRINDDFFKRRGGISYLKTVVSFKYKQYKKGFFSFVDFIVSAGGQAFVCLLPNNLRKWVYLKMLRK